MAKEEIEEIYDAKLFNIDSLNVLLHQTLSNLRKLLNAEGGTIYIKEGNVLKFNVFQNDLFSYENIYKQHYFQQDANLPLDKEGIYTAVDCYIKKEVIMVNNVYENSEYNFIGARVFDKKFNYKTHSILSIPLIHPFNDNTLGVIQLLNKIEGEEIIPFNAKDKETVLMLSSFIALFIDKAKTDMIALEDLKDKLKELNN